MTQTAKNFLPTSMPAHRSITAGIIGLLVLKPASAYPFTSCSASRSSFQGALHAGRTRFIIGAFTTTTLKGSPAPAPLFSLKHVAGVFIPQGGRRPCEVHQQLAMVFEVLDQERLTPPHGRTKTEHQRASQRHHRRREHRRIGDSK